MSLLPQMFTLSGLAVELRRDIRTVSRGLRGVPPDGTLKGRSAWFSETARRALDANKSRGGINPAEEKALLDRSRREISDLELGRLKRELIPVDEIKAILDDCGQIVRTNFVGLPSKLAPLLANQTATKCEAILRDGIDEVLTHLSSLKVAGAGEIEI